MNPNSTYDVQGACVDEDHGELNDLMVEVWGIDLLTGGFKVHHADVVVVCVGEASVGGGLHQFLLLIMTLQPLLHHILNTPVHKRERRLSHLQTFTE